MTTITGNSRKAQISLIFGKNVEVAYFQRASWLAGGWSLVDTTRAMDVTDAYTIARHWVEAGLRWQGARLVGGC